MLLNPAYDLFTEIKSLGTDLHTGNKATKLKYSRRLGLSRLGGLRSSIDYHSIIQIYLRRSNIQMEPPENA